LILQDHFQRRNTMTITELARVQIYEVLTVRLTDFDHLCRDLEQALALSGIADHTLQRRLIFVREATEIAADHVREPRATYDHSIA